MDLNCTLMENEKDKRHISQQGHMLSLILLHQLYGIVCSITITTSLDKLNKLK